MGRVVKVTVLALATLVLVIAIGIAGLMVHARMQPQTYDECVVGQMRGQDASVLTNVKALCERRFHVMLELAIPSGQWSWSGENGQIGIVTFSPFSETYRLSRIEVEISAKACSETLPADWSHKLTLWASTGDRATGTYAAPATCMRIVNAYGTRV